VRSSIHFRCTLLRCAFLNVSQETAFSTRAGKKFPSKHS